MAPLRISPGWLQDQRNFPAEMMGQTILNGNPMGWLQSAEKRAIINSQKKGIWMLGCCKTQRARGANQGFINTSGQFSLEILDGFLPGVFQTVPRAAPGVSGARRLTNLRLQDSSEKPDVHTPHLAKSYKVLRGAFFRVYQPGIAVDPGSIGEILAPYGL